MTLANNEFKNKKNAEALDILRKLEKGEDVSRWRCLSLESILYELTNKLEYSHLKDDVILQIDLAKESI